MSEETDSVVRRRPQSEPALEHKMSVEVLGAWPMKCAYAVQEIFKTEEDYIKDLHDLIMGYRTPLSYHLKTDNKGHKIIATLFGNVQDLYNLHLGLIEDLRNQKEDPHGFGKVFISTEPKFRQYTVYCTNYDTAIACLQTLLQDNDFAIFVSSCQHNLGHMLPLSSQLIKPVQRIMRYHIMLKEVVKHFDRNHHGYQSLCKAHSSMTKVGEYINEFKKQKENKERVLDLQSNTTGWSSKDVKNLSAYGELILEDCCKVGVRGIERQVVLFEKLLLILKKKDVKKYTYKGHVLTSEMHFDQRFCSQNATMIRVSSVLDSHHVYVLDMGSPRKQQEWRNKILALIRDFVDQTKKGITRKTGTPHEVKRRKIEEVDIGGDSMDSLDESKTKSMSLKFRQRSKAGRLLSKKRPHSDVRTLFPDQESSNSVKLKNYRVLDADNMTSQSLPQLQTSPPTTMSPPVAVQQLERIKDGPPVVVQHLERIVDETDTGAPSPPEPKSRPQSGVKKGMSGSTSMDSLLSLSDLDAGMEIQTSPRRNTSSGEAADSNHIRQKPMRRAAIKVKRSKTFSGVSAGSSSAEIIKQRAKEVREASLSPPPFLAGVIAENGADEESDSRSTSEVGSSLFGVPSAVDSTSSSSMVHEQMLVQHDFDMEATPTPDDVLGTRDRAKVSSRSPERSLVNSLSALKRPRSGSQEQAAVESSDSSNVSVELLVGMEDDDLELGESCGQSLLRGRVGMPTSVDHTLPDVDEEQRYLEGVHGEGAMALGEDSDSDWLSASLGDTGSHEDGFVIVEDSSDTEDDEEEDSNDDLEKAGEDIVASLLEVVDMEEASDQHKETTEESEPSESGSMDQVVPQADDNGTALETPEKRQDPSSKSPDSSAPFFHFQGSTDRDRTIDIYGTLPSKKKRSKQISSNPLLSPTSSQPSAISGELSRSSLRRIEGFSRLIEFTRMQVSLDDSSDEHSSSSLDWKELDVSQSLPVVSKFSLENINEDGEQETAGLADNLGNSLSKIKEFKGDELDKEVVVNGNTEERIEVVSELGQRERLHDKDKVHDKTDDVVPLEDQVSEMLSSKEEPHICTSTAGGDISESYGNNELQKVDEVVTTHLAYENFNAISEDDLEKPLKQENLMAMSEGDLEKPLEQTTQVPFVPDVIPSVETTRHEDISEGDEPIREQTVEYKENESVENRPSDPEANGDGKITEQTIECKEDIVEKKLSDPDANYKVGGGLSDSISFQGSGMDAGLKVDVTSSQEDHVMKTSNSLHSLHEEEHTEKGFEETSFLVSNIHQNTDDSTPSANHESNTQQQPLDDVGSSEDSNNNQSSVPGAMEGQSNLKTRLNRTFWDQVSNYRPSYRTIFILGIAVIAGIVYNIYYS